MSRLRFLLSVAAGVGALYGATLLAVSLSSREVVLGFQQPKRFCGLYLDCHRMVEVVGVDTTEAIVSGTDTLHANGRFHVVTLRYSSDAVRAAIRMGPLAAIVRDADGGSYRRDAAAERLLAGQAGLVDLRIPAGGAVTTRIVFDLPAGAADPRLDVRDAHPVSRLTELLLVGDEDSFLHQRTVFALSGEAPRRTGLLPSTVDLLAVRVEPAAGPAIERVPADGVFYVVTLDIPADTPFVATVIDRDGRRYGRAHDVEDLLRHHDPLGDPGRIRLVFDLPDRIPAPRLVLREPGLGARLFGRPVTLRL